MEADNLDLEVRFNGQPIGRVTVSRSASKRDIELAAMAHPEVQKRLGDDTVKGLTLVEDDAINIVV